MASLSLIAYSGSLIGPPLVGFVADNAGLRVGLATLLPLMVLSALFAGSLRRPMVGTRIDDKKKEAEHAARHQGRRTRRTGGHEVGRRADAGAGPGQARVRHTAIGVNFVDVYYRTGIYPPRRPSLSCRAPKPPAWSRRSARA